MTAVLNVGIIVAALDDFKVAVVDWSSIATILFFAVVAQGASITAAVFNFGITVCTSLDTSILIVSGGAGRGAGVKIAAPD